MFYNAKRLESVETQIHLDKFVVVISFHLVLIKLYLYTSNFIVLPAKVKSYVNPTQCLHFKIVVFRIANFSTTKWAIFQIG